MANYFCHFINMAVTGHVPLFLPLLYTLCLVMILANRFAKAY